MMDAKEKTRLIDPDQIVEEEFEESDQEVTQPNRKTTHRHMSFAPNVITQSDEPVEAQESNAALQEVRKMSLLQRR